MRTQLPSLLMRDPFRGLLESFFTDTMPEAASGDMQPRTNIAENEHGYVLSFELPGIGIDDIQVQVHDRQLTVTAERREEERKEGTTFHRVEHRYGKFTRSILLPEATSADKVQASFDKGILTVTVPKKPESKPTRVQIKSS